MKYLLFILLLVPNALTAQLAGKVVSIADGDTFTLLVENRQVKIRLHGIDCPEKKQDFGNAAKQYLSGLIFGKEVSVREMGKDRYKRTIRMVTLGGINVNEAMLTAGYAWHYIEYDKNPAWSALEESARRQKKGLWARPNPTPPWKFRKRRKLLGTRNSELVARGSELVACRSRMAVRPLEIAKPPTLTVLRNHSPRRS